MDKKKKRKKKTAPNSRRRIELNMLMYVNDRKIKIRPIHTMATFMTRLKKHIYVLARAHTHRPKPKQPKATKTTT